MEKKRKKMIQDLKARWDEAKKELDELINAIKLTVKTGETITLSDAQLSDFRNIYEEIEQIDINTLSFENLNLMKDLTSLMSSFAYHAIRRDGIEF